MNESYKPESWDLSDVLPKDFDAKCEDIRKLVKRFCRYRSKLSPSMRECELMRSLKLFDKINTELEVIGSAYTLRFYEDTSDSESSRMLANANRFAEEIRNKIDFFDSWILNLSQKGLRRVLSHSGEYKSYIKDMAKSEKYSLEGDVEDALSLKESTGSALRSRLYYQIVSGFRYPEVVGGENRMLSTSELMQRYSDTDPAKRADAYGRILQEYSKFAHVLAELYSAEVQDWDKEYVKTRKHRSTMSVVNFENEISDSAVDTLLAVCRRNRDVFQRYFKLKARVCGLEGKFSLSDVDAPMFSLDRKFGFGEAVSEVINSFSSFSSKFGCLAKRVLDSGHLHSLNRANQIESTFCMGVAPGVVPYVYIVPDVRLEYVQTLAHELGHAVHYQLIGEKQNSLVGEANNVIAETVSAFSEQLLFEHIISHADDDSVRKALLAFQLGNYQETVSQAYNVLFEKAAHEMLNSAQGAGHKQISDLYYSQLKEQFGDSMIIPDQFKDYWLVISHIFEAPFYCYSYSFGYLMSLILNQKRKSEGPEFVREFERVISYGNSVPTARVFKELGIDINSSRLWQKGFDILDEKFGYLESLCR